MDSLIATMFAVAGNSARQLDMSKFELLQITNASDNMRIPETFTLHQNYPNPFNPTTTIGYSVRAYDHTPLHVNLSIYNLSGQKVATLVDKIQSAGRYQVEWDASGFASGIYYYKIHAGEFVDVKKMILLH